MSDDRIPCAILGAGGYIGQHFLRLLAEHPLFAPPELIAGTRSSGRRLAELWQLSDPPPDGWGSVRLRASTPASLARSGVRVVFSAVSTGSAGTVEAALIRRNVAVFSNAADHRLDTWVPLLVPEVNPAHLRLVDGRRGVPLVTNPNCTATGLVLALKPVWDLLRPRAVHVATYQSVSGAGYPGVSSLSIVDNVLPYISEEEEKVERESQRILGRLEKGRVRSDRTPFVVHCARVAVREGHLEAVSVEARHSPRLSEIRSAWQRFRPLSRLRLPTAPRDPVRLVSELDRPQPLRDRWSGDPPRARGMSAVVGRIRWEPPFLRFFVLSHNAVRGGAGGSVLNAEFVAVHGRIPGAGRTGAAVR